MSTCLCTHILGALLLLLFPSIPPIHVRAKSPILYFASEPQFNMAVSQILPPECFLLLGKSCRRDKLFMFIHHLSCFIRRKGGGSETKADCEKHFPTLGAISRVINVQSSCHPGVGLHVYLATASGSTLMKTTIYLLS